MTLAVIDYGAGNLQSVLNVMKRVGGQPVALVSDAAQLADATHIVLPGVGAFGDCMRGLAAVPGMVAALEQRVLKEGAPFLGICVGMQLLFECGYEHGVHAGLGWLAGEVVPLAPADASLKIPHMGWNELVLINEGGLAPTAALPPPASPPRTCSVGSAANRLFAGIEEGAHAYFVHSYHCVAKDAAEVIATVDYGGPVTAAVARGNIMGVQFHPEKSQQTGLQLFRNFLHMRPSCPTVLNA